ncbi:FHA domain-containing protein FhaB/FipA [Actinomyces polynesiensis]|uniref:FHA domain-containing protein FhaB/FipA n=1 Tax=Actinomyces polynesiensis TaxID=1325934 RepID=UPI0005BDCB10|nr:FHA domain-containing protein [Actinomyces polynesiensis]
MISDLAFTVFRIGYLALLWAMVFGAVAILRRDIFGTVVTPRGKGRRRAGKERRRSRRERRATGASPQDTTPHNLLITGGPLVGTMMPLGSAPIVIGRSPSSTLVLDDEYASARHARLSSQEGQWWIEDLGSRNGTFVDDERITEPRVVQPGTTVRIGQTTLELVR